MNNNEEPKRPDKASKRRIVVRMTSRDKNDPQAVLDAVRNALNDYQIILEVRTAEKAPDAATPDPVEVAAEEAIKSAVRDAAEHPAVVDEALEILARNAASRILNEASALMESRGQESEHAFSKLAGSYVEALAAVCARETARILATARALAGRSLAAAHALALAGAAAGVSSLAIASESAPLLIAGLAFGLAASKSFWEWTARSRHRSGVNWFLERVRCSVAGNGDPGPRAEGSRL